MVDNRKSEGDLGRWIEKPVRSSAGYRYRRYVVRTHVIQPGEHLVKTLAPYLEGRVNPEDIVVLGEKIVAISEGRAVLISTIKPRFLARYLAKRVRPLGYGIGLRRPETMEMAFREAGVLKMLIAAIAGAKGRLFHQRGNFYRLAGRRVAAIDGPGPTTIAPYNRYIILAPEHPESVVLSMQRRFGCQVAVVDVNDVGSEVLITSDSRNHAAVQTLMADNPMGQGRQATPVAILRPEGQRDDSLIWPIGCPNPESGWVMPLGGHGDGAMEILS